MFKWLERVFNRKRRLKLPQLNIINTPQINREHLSQNALYVVEHLQDNGFEAYIVGGAVRDLLLGLQPKDFDVATNATPEQVVKLFKKSRIIGKRFQIVHVNFYQRKTQEIIEVSTFRAAAGSDSNNTNNLNIKDDINNANIIETSINAADLSNKPRKLKKYGETYPAELMQARQVNQTGQVLSDNTWGTQAQDASRRDFTINAMYYDPCKHQIFDYYQGLADIEEKRLCIIGEAEQRYREDPVRMLRVARFMAKTQFNIDKTTLEPIEELAPLLKNIPQARLLDELLKMLTSGFSGLCIDHAHAFGLAPYILPWFEAFNQLSDQNKHLIDFIDLVLERTDARIAENKGVALGFIFAGVYWPILWQNWQFYGQQINPETGQTLSKNHAFELAIDETLDKQQITYRIMDDMREIWGLQMRLEKRHAKSALTLLNHPRFRAGFDFLELRALSEQDPVLIELFEWWEIFQTPEADRMQMLDAVAADLKKQDKDKNKSSSKNKDGKDNKNNKDNKKSSKKNKAAKIDNINEDNKIDENNEVDENIEKNHQKDNHVEIENIEESNTDAQAPKKRRRRKKKSPTDNTDAGVE